MDGGGADDLDGDGEDRRGVREVEVHPGDEGEGEGEVLRDRWEPREAVAEEEPTWARADAELAVAEEGVRDGVVEEKRWLRKGLLSKVLGVPGPGELQRERAVSACTEPGDDEGEPQTLLRCVGGRQRIRGGP